MDASGHVPLLCRLGRHRPRATTRWNNGFYFTRCARCGQDLVRTPFGRWQVPRGYRIVWQAHAPANAASAELVRAREAPDAEGARELPIQEVLRHVQNGDKSGDAPGGWTDADVAGADAAAAPGPPAAEPPAADADAGGDSSFAELDAMAQTQPRSRIGDFMDEATGGDGWQPPARRYLVRPAAPDPDAAGETEEPDAGALARLRARFAARFARAPDADGEDGTSPAVPRGLLAALAIMLALVLALLALIFFAGQDGAGPGGFNDSAGRGAPIGPEQGQSAFVTASVLNCREAPAREAEPVAVMTRGDPVRLLERDGEWVSLVYRGGQCWALYRFFSVERPIQGIPS